ncbi:MAG: hypothetical protein ACFNYB_01545 [Campylobacter sp.]
MKSRVLARRFCGLKSENERNLIARTNAQTREILANLRSSK